MRSLIPLSLLIAVLNTPVHAAIFPFHVHFSRNPFASITRRAPLPIGNTGNAQYVANISLSGNSVPVLLDTGSSDLWAYIPKPLATTNFTDTGKSVTLSYAVGKAEGHVQTAKVDFAGYSLDSQAFLYVTDTSTFTGDLTAQGYTGLLGLGPNSGSVIRKKLDGDTGDSTLQNIFKQNKTSSNYITFLLDRKNDTAEPFTGQMTISEIVPGFENITTMPKLDVETVTRLLKSDQHWQALTDKDNGVIGPDGQVINIESIVPKAPNGQLVAVIDSGFTFSQVPRDMSDAIYGRIQGATYDSSNEWWLVPCGQYLNVSLNFGGQNYPIHPLDLVDDNFRVISNGKKVCIGSFQPITSAFSLLGHYDMILGMNFLRNAYTLLDFGSWITTSSSQEHPFIQMASLTNAAFARQDFIQTRLGGVDTISDPKWTLLSADQIQHSPVSAEEKKKKYQEMVLSRWPYILLGCLVFVVGVTGFCIWRCCCRKKAKADKDWTEQGMFGKNKKGGKAERSSYVPLEASNPQLAAPYESTQDLTPKHYDESYHQPPYPQHMYRPSNDHRLSEGNYQQQNSYGYGR